MKTDKILFALNAGNVYTLYDFKNEKQYMVDTNNGKSYLYMVKFKDNNQSIYVISSKDLSHLQYLYTYIHTIVDNISDESELVSSNMKGLAYNIDDRSYNLESFTINNIKGEFNND